MRCLLFTLVGLLCLGAVGCVGDTDPASHIRATQAQLNAHGRTNNGPASWWWEYGTSQSAVQNGQGTDTPHRGPASSPNDVALSEVAKGLTPGKTYYFRACGQDQNSSNQVCGSIRSFVTSPADSSAWSGAFGLAYAKFTGATTVSHADWRAYTANGRLFIEEQQFSFGAPPLGGTIGPGPNCSAVNIGTYDRAVDCSLAGITFLDASFGDYRDEADVLDLNLPTLLSGGFGNDVFVGGTQSDTFFGGPGDDQLAGNGGRDFVTGDAGADTLHGNGGDDDVDARDGDFLDQVDCGSGTDRAFVDIAGGLADEYLYALNHGCETVSTSNPAATGARSARMAELDRLRRR